MRTGWLLALWLASTLADSADADSKKPPPPSVPSIPKGAVTISPAALEALRTSGSARIEPQPESIAAMRSDGVATVTGQVLVCLSTAGGVTHAEMAKTTGYPTYDRRITAEVVDWMFVPHKVNGKAVMACSTLAISYTVDKTKPAQSAAGCRLGDGSEAHVRALRTDLDMICGAAKATSGKDFMAVGPYIAERMKTDLLADLFANIRTTTTLDMIVTCVRSAMAKADVKTCATVDVLLANRPR